MDILGYEVRGCPRCMVDGTPEVYVFLRWYKFFEMGHLPFSGTLADQPAVLVEAFETIGEVNGRKQAQHRPNN